MKRARIITVVAIGLAAASVGVAQFGGIVFDPTVDAHLLEQTLQVIQELKTLLATYQTIQNTYTIVENNAKMIQGRGLWAYVMPPTVFPTAGNTYGNTAGWVGSLASGVQAANHYVMATLPATNPGGLYRTLSAVGQSRFSTHYATMEINDGVAANAMAVTGGARSNMAAQQAAIGRLQSATLSDDPSQNTEIGLLNKVNAAAVINAQSQQGTNQLLAAAIDQQTIELKVRHDLMVGEMNAAIAAQAQASANTDSLWGNNTAAHAARLP